MKLIIDISKEAYNGIKMGMRNRDDMREVGEAIENGIPYETVTEFADRCRECGAKYGKLLKQEPCDDAVSRYGAIKAIDERAKRIKNEDTLNGLAGAVGILYELPPVKPQEPKTGHWIERRSRATGHIESVCSECGAEEGYPYNDYCGNCGAKMFEP